ncbi:MAG: hypothetical protein ACLT0Y_09000 [Christensenellales bacterium]
MTYSGSKFMQSLGFRQHARAFAPSAVGVGKPGRQCRFIHVAGTNGKGSVCKMLSSVLCQGDAAQGCTSPYLHSMQGKYR